ncbi:hypothetical protein BpOF4_17175 [Alkalihalophilus pseudofirmus OF4]|uniref:Uncharacterized protein n=1 Tax=Alkalihalophilus pseudofirmus (strain ATCC BAA-2126 / JCM 17055 / OF4) TaxID=398511 RepID=D3FQV6_ALKPO|nr:hypothetical protein [Alkalihalophilus pseudofirmus]ADC51476.1 hypothetical protein BpOF4_17175 [Alkalihalophilus pseudofirmus OF4]
MAKIERVLAKEPNILMDEALSNKSIQGQYYYWEQADSISFKVEFR